MITAGCLLIGYYYMQQGSSESTVRTVIFTTLLFSNIFLTLVNRSFHFSLLTTMRYRNNLVPIIIGITLVFMATFVYVPYAREIFRLQQISPQAILICMTTAMLATLWIELWKAIRRRRMAS